MDDPAVNTSSGQTIDPETANADDPPDLELLASVERDLGHVEQSLVDLLDESADPAAVIAWIGDGDEAEVEVDETGGPEQGDASS